MNTEENILKINLMKKPQNLESTVVVQQHEPLKAATTGMTLDHLRENYEAILRAQAIFYPIAYQFRKELGRGRQGVVYLGLRQGARGCITEHAIKIFDPQLYRSPAEYWTDMGRIASQISALHRIQSPNLVAGHIYEETYGIGYVEMECIDGVDLRYFLSGAHIPAVRENCTEEEWAYFTETIFRLDGDRVALQPGMVVYILRSVLLGLECLHDANFLHCDIKPANIMIGRLGNVKLVDLGRAVMIGEKVSFLLGSPMYMAPETHQRKPGGPESDLYSLGLVGLEMLRGEPLTDAEEVDEKELLEIKMSLPARLPELLPPHVRDNLYQVYTLRRFLDPDPRKRYASAREADVGNDGLILVDRQFSQTGADTEYARALSDYLAKLVDERTKRIELPEHPIPSNSPSPLYP
jgi:serine/threonine-protein kinase